MTGFPNEKAWGGWVISKERGFSPYVDGLIFDGDANFRTLFSASPITGNTTNG